MRLRSETDKKRLLEEVTQAHIPQEVYEKYKKDSQRKSELLKDSIRKFSPPFYEPVVWEFDYSKYPIKLQGEYTEIPFRNEKYDSKSTIATSGCGILIAEFIGYFYNCEEKYTVEELAQMAVEKGYRGYVEKDGKMKPAGLRHSFFEVVVETLYCGLIVEMAQDIFKVFHELTRKSLSILLVKNSIYKNDPTNKENHFIVIIGFTEKEIVFYDPEIGIDRKPFETILNATEKAWVCNNLNEYCL